MMKKILLLLVVLALLAAVLAACNQVEDGPLPRSMKGYELYSWQQGGAWHFTLITGTNRNKTLEEIVFGESELSEDGWVNLHARGVEKIKKIISRVPEGEFLIWSYGNFITQSNINVVLELPPADIVDELKEHAEKHGLELLTH